MDIQFLGYLKIQFLKSSVQEYLYNEYIWIVNRVPDKYIARFMGISNAWYCKLKKRLFDSGKV
jgi:hypothetical protein